MDDEAKVLIKAGDVEIDLSGAQNSVDERLIRVKEDDTWSIALSRIITLQNALLKCVIFAASMLASMRRLSRKQRKKFMLN